MIIGAPVSPILRRLLATCGVLVAFGGGFSIATAASIPDSTWVAVAPLPAQGHTPIFAIAVDPSNSQAVLVANSAGSIYRSTNGGSSWTPVYSGRAEVTTVAYSPFAATLVLAGTRGGGALISHDGGSTWSPVTGLDGRSVRVFGFALTAVVAGTDRGVYVSSDGARWNLSGLPTQSISALAIEAIHDPVRIVAGTDSVSGGGTMPLFQSLDGGATWKTLAPAISGTITVKLVAGPLPPTGNVRPLLVATNSGLFISADNGTTFTPLSGGGLLPTTDYSQAAFIGQHFDRFYAGSDGGGSGSGGLWRTTTSGRTFASLQPPEPSLTALGVSSDDKPTLYAATFNTRTHVATIWAYHDTGGPPLGPRLTPSPLVSGARTTTAPGTPTLAALIASPQLPYVALGVAAVLVLLTASVAHLRGRRR